MSWTSGEDAELKLMIVFLDLLEDEYWRVSALDAILAW